MNGLYNIKTTNIEPSELNTDMNTEFYHDKITFKSYLKGRWSARMKLLYKDTFYMLLYQYRNNFNIFRKILKWKWEDSRRDGYCGDKFIVDRYIRDYANLKTFILYCKYTPDFPAYSALYRKDLRFVKIILKKINGLNKQFLNDFPDTGAGFYFDRGNILEEHINDNIKMCKFVVKQLNNNVYTEYCNCGAIEDEDFKGVPKHIELHKLKLTVRKVLSVKCFLNCNFHISVINFDHETNTKYKLVELISKRFTTKNINKMISYFI